MKRQTANKPKPRKPNTITGAGLHPYRQIGPSPAGAAGPPEPAAPRSTANQNNGTTPREQAFTGRGDTKMPYEREHLRAAIRDAERKLNPRPPEAA